MVSFKGANRNKKNGVVELSGELTINNIYEAKKNLDTAISKSQMLELQFGDIDRIDMAFIQLIHATAKTARDTAKGIKISHPLPDMVQSTIQTMGLGHLELWQQA